MTARPAHNAGRPTNGSSCATAAESPQPASPAGKSPAGVHLAQASFSFFAPGQGGAPAALAAAATEAPTPCSTLCPHPRAAAAAAATGTAAAPPGHGTALVAASVTGQSALGGQREGQQVAYPLSLHGPPPPCPPSCGAGTPQSAPTAQEASPSSSQVSSFGPGVTPAGGQADNTATAATAEAASRVSFSFGGDSVSPADQGAALQAQASQAASPAAATSRGSFSFGGGSPGAASVSFGGPGIKVAPCPGTRPGRHSPSVTSGQSFSFGAHAGDRLELQPDATPVNLRCAAADKPRGLQTGDVPVLFLCGDFWFISFNIAPQILEIPLVLG